VEVGTTEHFACDLHFNISIDSGESKLGADISFYKLEEENATEAVSYNMLVIHQSKKPSLNMLVGEKTIPATSKGWQVFHIDKVASLLQQGYDNVLIKFLVFKIDETLKELSCPEISSLFVLNDEKLRQTDQGSEETNQITKNGTQPTQGATEDEQPTQGATGDEQPTQGATEDEQPTQGATGDEQPTQGNVSQEQPTQVNVSQEQPTQVNVSQEQPTQVNVSQEQPTQVNVSQEQPTQNGTTEDPSITTIFDRQNYVPVFTVFIRPTSWPFRSQGKRATDAVKMDQSLKMDSPNKTCKIQDYRVGVDQIIPGATVIEPKSVNIKKCSGQCRKDENNNNLPPSSRLTQCNPTSYSNLDVLLQEGDALTIHTLADAIINECSCA